MYIRMSTYFVEEVQRYEPTAKEEQGTQTDEVGGALDLLLFHLSFL